MQVPQVPPLDAPMSGGFVLKAFYLWAHCSEWGSGGSPGSAARRSCSDGNRKGVHEALEVCSYPPLVRGLFDTNGDRHAKVGHPIEDHTTVMPGCGCSPRRCRRPQSCSIGGMSPFVLSTRCRRRAVSARVRPTQILPMRRLVTWSGRNGACGAAGGPAAGASWQACTAGRSASRCAR
jgi:hypothetical protein